MLQKTFEFHAPWAPFAADDQQHVPVVGFGFVHGDGNVFFCVGGRIIDCDAGLLAGGYPGNQQHEDHEP